MRKTFFLAVLILFLVNGSANALTLEEGVEILPSESNTTYEVNTTLSLDSLDVESNAPYLNGYIFQIEPDSGSATVKISRWEPPDMEFEITATDNVEITLGGFIANKHYTVSVDGNRYRTFFNANATGVLYFNYSLWSTHIFIVEKYVLPTGRGGTTPIIIPATFDFANGDEPGEDFFPWFVFAVTIFLGFVLLVIMIIIKKRK